MASLHRTVERLTQEQFRVIQMLSGLERVRITGCPGSGKTLVAAEKAIRLSKAGLKTLFLCHNPLLAQHVAQLTKGVGVQVEAFGHWVTTLADLPGSKASSSYSIYEEPDQITLDTAFDTVVDRGPYWDAIIVDEGQDFRDTWWVIVEASFKRNGAGIFYIFHDDAQSLLLYRAKYPEGWPVVDLSRNCRNAGQIYEFMRYLYPQAPEPELDLAGSGKTRMFPYTPGMEQDAVEKAARWINQGSPTTHIVVLKSGTRPVSESFLASMQITLPTIHGTQWQDEVRNKFALVFRGVVRHGIQYPQGGSPWLREQLSKLSTEITPTSADIELVRKVAKSFRIDPTRRANLRAFPHYLGRMEWKIVNNNLKLQRRHMHEERWQPEIIMHFEREDWAEGIPKPRVIDICPYFIASGPNCIPAYNISDFKGLEADAAIVILGHQEASRNNPTAYVGISRAKFLLAVLVDTSAFATLPSEFTKYTSDVPNTSF